MVVCQYFLKGDCRFGDKCRYEHPSAKKKTAVCPYFLNGSCRFGDKCRNEHPRSGGGQGASGGTFTRQTSSRAAGQWNRSYHHNENRFEVLSGGDSVFGGRHSRPTDNEQTIQQTIKSDMEIWERSHQWPLSCYTYTKEEPSFQGLQDFSPEEIRLEAYMANAKGTADIYEHGLKQLISENQQRRHHLSNMSVSQIQDEIKKNSRHGSVHVVDAGSRSGVFVGTAGSFSQLGGASNASSSVTQSSGLFGAGNPSNQSGLFGQTSVTKGNSGTLFGGSPTTGTMFGGLSTSGTTFGGSTTTGTLFSGSPNSGTTFGGSSQTSSMKISNQSGGLFGASTAGPSPDSGSLFGFSSPAVSSGSFSTGSVPQTVKNRTDSQSINVSANSLKSNIGTSSGKESSTVVSSTAKQALTCSEQDMQAFMADSFVLGKIPECPPPLELC